MAIASHKYYKFYHSNIFVPQTELYWFSYFILNIDNSCQTLYSKVGSSIYISDNKQIKGHEVIFPWKLFVFSISRYSVSQIVFGYFSRLILVQVFLQDAFELSFVCLNRPFVSGRVSYRWTLRLDSNFSLSRRFLLLELDLGRQALSAFLDLWVRSTSFLRFLYFW